MANEALTPKQACFVQEYLKDLNATQAAIRAGYSERTARQTGAENLSKPVIAAAIAAAKQGRSKRTELDQDWVVRRLRIEAKRRGKGASHGARISALKLLGQHVGMFADRAPLETLLASLPAELGLAIRGYLAARLAEGPGPAGGGPGPTDPPP